MTTYKIYIKNNFLQIVNNDNEFVTDINLKDAKVVRHDLTQDWYDVFDKTNRILSRVYIDAFQDENGDAYTDGAFLDLRAALSKKVLK
jgi:hypothetical protein